MSEMILRIVSRIHPVDRFPAAPRHYSATPTAGSSARLTAHSRSIRCSARVLPPRGGPLPETLPLRPTSARAGTAQTCSLILSRRCAGRSASTRGDTKNAIRCPRRSNRLCGFAPISEGGPLGRRARRRPVAGRAAHAGREPPQAGSSGLAAHRRRRAVRPRGDRPGRADRTRPVRPWRPTGPGRRAARRMGGRRPFAPTSTLLVALLSALRGDRGQRLRQAQRPAQRLAPVSAVSTSWVRPGGSSRPMRACSTSEMKTS